MFCEHASSNVRFGISGMASQLTLMTVSKSPKIVGAVVSSIVKVAVAVAKLPHSSVAVKVTVAEPVAPHSSESDVKLLVQVRLVEQLSEAEAPPLEANQSLSAWVLP